MNNQKDTQKNSLNHYGHGNVLDIKSFANKNIFDFACKKTEKLVTALYMVTDCMDADDALKNKLRELGVELLSDIYKLPSYSPMNKYDHVSVSLSRIYEIISFVGIANTMGFVSDMNSAILRKEFSFLIKELESHQTKDKHFTFTLDQGMFSLPILKNDNGHKFGLRDNQSPNNFIIKDKSRDHTDKRTNNLNMSFINPESNFLSNENLNNGYNHTTLSDREERKNKVIAIMKDVSLRTGGEVSIKDIASALTDFSEKTIQRELNNLVLNKKVKKTGSKRWSKYMIVESSK